MFYCFTVLIFHKYTFRNLLARYAFMFFPPKFIPFCKYCRSNILLSFVLIYNIVSLPTSYLLCKYVYLFSKNEHPTDKDSYFKVGTFTFRDENEISA